MNKARVAIYVNNKIQYQRKEDLEGTNDSIIVIDIMQDKPTRIINIYPTFTHCGHLNQKTKCLYQLGIIKAEITPNTILLGDFNLEDSKPAFLNHRDRSRYGTKKVLSGTRKIYKIKD